MRTYPTRAAADAAARREMRAIYGKSYQPKAGVDFCLARKPWLDGWTFEIINEAAHRAAANA